MTKQAMLLGGALISFLLYTTATAPVTAHTIVLAKEAGAASEADLSAQRRGGGRAGGGARRGGGGARAGGARAGRAGVARGRAVRGGAVRGGVVRGGAVRRGGVGRVGAVGVRRPVRRWVRRPYYGRWVSGVALGTVIAATAAAVVPAAPDPSLCWFWSNSSMTRGYWDYCAPQ